MGAGTFLYTCDIRCKLSIKTKYIQGSTGGYHGASRQEIIDDSNARHPVSPSYLTLDIVIAIAKILTAETLDSLCYIFQLSCR